jgi:hypothetical protein
MFPSEKVGSELVGVNISALPKEEKLASSAHIRVPAVASYDRFHQKSWQCY